MKIENELSKKILEYLDKKPDAGDTLEGITEWWLESERVDQAVDQVAEVLEALIKKGLIIKSKYGVYKLAKN
jgi:Mn-dependent DtxR family transcriptional regulator